VYGEVISIHATEHVTTRPSTSDALLQRACSFYVAIMVCLCVYCDINLIPRWPQQRKVRRKRGVQPSMRWSPESTPSTSTSASMACEYYHCCYYYYYYYYTTAAATATTTTTITITITILILLLLLLLYYCCYYY